MAENGYASILRSMSFDEDDSYGDYGVMRVMFSIRDYGNNSFFYPFIGFSIFGRFRSSLIARWPESSSEVSDR